ncbi:VTT domain-containing protein [Chryseolinea sp. T2]|uniref:TVP38/TMEM64 family protein n=1 Tax=Chryseolinea sp. T2 TaxID=3129255 RepID=UPI003077E1AB
MTSAGEKSFWKKYGMLVVSVVLIVGLVISYFAIPEFKQGVHNAWEAISSNDQERIRSWVKRFGILGPIILILVMAVQIFLLFIPNLLLFVIAVMCYGPIWGTVISLIGVTASSSLGYYIGNKLGPRAIDRFVSEKAQEKVAFFVRRYGAKAIFVFRLSSLSSDALGFVAGILEMSYKKFVLATLVGITPVLILLAIYGRNGRIDRALIWLGAFAVAALLIYVLFDRKNRKTAFKEIEAHN